MVAVPTGAESPLRVLVVDDCRDNADSLAIVLSHWNCELRVCYDAASSLVEAATFQPDVVIADIAMPGANGLDLAAQLRDRDPVPHALIALSGYADSARRQAAEAVGFDFYLVKPPDLAELRRLLESAGKMAASCRRIAALADRTDELTEESRGLIDGIRADLRTARS